MTERIVPWVALRKNEYEDEHSNRVPWTPWGIEVPADNRGVRWMAYEGTMDGDVLFSQVHPIRQKLCMETPRCQVCGKTLDPRRTPWLMDDDTSDENPDVFKRPINTSTPPTCVECQDVARGLCPHLGKTGGGVSLVVRKFSVVGVFGDYYPTGHADDRELGVTVFFGNPNHRKLLRHFMAKQLVVELRQYRLASSERSD